VDGDLNFTLPRMNDHFVDQTGSQASLAFLSPWGWRPGS